MGSAARTTPSGEHEELGNQHNGRGAVQRIIPTSPRAAAAPGALVGLAHLGTWAVPHARHRLRPVRPELVPTRPIRLPRPLSPHSHCPT